MTLTKVVDLILDRILTFTDYYLVKKHVTLSESSVFMFSITRCLWFGIFGVRDINYDMLWGGEIWFFTYLFLTLSHFFAFFSPKLIIRAAVLFLNAFIWSFLAILAYFSGNRSPALPGSVILSLLCIFIGVRLYMGKPEESDLVKV